MTQADEATTELRFEPPGPGRGNSTRSTFRGPVTRYWAETHPEAFRRGSGDFTASTAC